MSAKGMCKNHRAAWRYANEPGFRERVKANKARRRSDPEKRERDNATESRRRQRPDVQEFLYASHVRWRKERGGAEKVREHRRGLAEDPDYRRRRQYYEAVRTARKKGAPGSFTWADWRARLVGEFGGLCVACGATEHVELDHVVPLSAGGTNYLDNTQPLCCSCNSAKGNRRIQAYLPWNGAPRMTADISLRVSPPSRGRARPG